MPDGGQRPPPPPPSRPAPVDDQGVSIVELAKDSRSISQLKRDKQHLDEIIAAKRALGEDEGEEGADA